MKTTRFFLLLLLSASASTVFGTNKPNIILIMLDDVSPDMYSCYAPYTPKGLGHAGTTPNIDRLASKGVMFKTCYATSMCGPTRVQIMTGRYAQATGVYHNSMWVNRRSNRYLEDFPSFGKLLKEAGYATAIAGKWHAGAIQPYAEVGGFDEYCLWSSLNELSHLPGFTEWTGGMEDSRTTSRYWHPALIQNGVLLDTQPEDYGPDLCNQFLMDFMERSVADGKPFLAYWPCVAPHGTRQGMPTNPLRGEVGEMGSSDSSEKNARFKSLNEYIDLLVGRTVDKVNELGIADNTIIILTSDNGTAVTAKTRGVERGPHVMNIIAGGGVVQRGATNALTDFCDIAPTLVELAGATLPDGYAFDGESLVPFLMGEKDDHREWIYGYISTTQIIRTKEYLLEAVNPLLGFPQGRFSYTGQHRFREGYVRAEGMDEHKPALEELRKILEQFPPVTENHPYWTTSKGQSYLEDYRDPASIAKHLHNHKDWVYYDESYGAYLSVSLPEPGMTRIVWSPPEGILQWAVQLAGPWHQLDAASPLIEQGVNISRFYRLQLPVN
jgi:arylsulfatase A-like enzyme